MGYLELDLPSAAEPTTHFDAPLYIGDDKGDDGDGEDTGAYLDPIVPATNYTDATRSSRKGFRSKQ